MVWVASIIVLVLFFLFPKKMFGLASVLLVFGLAVFGYLTYEEAQTRKEKSLVTINIEHSPDECKEPYPLKVVIKNMSGRTVKKVDFDMVVTKKGFSTNLVHYSVRNYSSDKILKNREGWKMCYRVPKLNEQVKNYAGLDYSTEYKFVYFER